MHIIEVKNNLVKISYEPKQDGLILSGFLVIKDSNQSFVSQVMHLEANQSGNFAIVKLLFNFDNSGLVTNYNGSIPDINSVLVTVTAEEILEMVPVENPVIFGELAQQNTVLKLDRSTFEEKLLVCIENIENNIIFTENMAVQLANAGKKVLIIDASGDFPGNKLIAGKNFKLPLNYETINFIYEKGLVDANSQTKALIQEVFLEVQNYVKTLPDKFLPFNSFKSVVDDQYQELNLVELVLLKNKLLKFDEAGIFAQIKAEFNVLQTSLMAQNLTVLDISGVDDAIQREMISFAYSLTEKMQQDIYVIVQVSNSNSDKKLLKQIFSTQNAFSTVSCSYSYKYLNELKQISKNLILFAPIQQQNDFATYNAFLNKLNQDEFIVYGKSTNHLPFIVKLARVADTVSYTPSNEPAPEVVQEAPLSREELLDEQIKKDVDIFYTAPKQGLTAETGFSLPSEAPFIVENLPNEHAFETDSFESEPESVEATEEIVFDDNLTEDDLDFIDALNSGQNQEINLEEIAEPQFAEEKLDYTMDEIIGASEEKTIEDILKFEETSQEQKPPIEEIFAKEETPVVDILPSSIASTPIVPIYSAEVEPKFDVEEDLNQGDTVMHAKYGKGVVEKMITYGSKTLCSINFDNVGRRLLDPTLTELKKI